MGGVFKREYIWWNIRKDCVPLRNVRGLLRTQEPTSIIQTQDIGRGVGDYRKSQPKIRHLSQMAANAVPIPTKRTFGERFHKKRINYGLWKGFSSSSSSDRLTEEQENEIAENIYDWWISGKSYKQWYAEKFQQMKLDFGDEL